MVLCSHNEYFNGLCGLESQFAVGARCASSISRMSLTPEEESKQTAIELKGDDPDALEGVLRNIYGFKAETYHDKPWEYWLALIETADKYLEPGLSKRAAIHFKAAALNLGEQDLGTVYDILDTLQDVDKYESSKGFVVELARKHSKSLGDERFRAQLYSSTRIVFKLLERLSFATEMVPEEKACAQHGPHVVYRQK
jgi:hypothetical protein